MQNLPLIITIIVLVCIGWLIFDNYERDHAPPTPTPPAVNIKK